MKKQTIGFWDKGKETQLINCSSKGFDIGLKSEGEDLYAENFKSIHQESFLNDKKQIWYLKWWMKYIIYPLIVGLVLVLSSYLF
jgi:hypothetical protein